MRDERRDGVDLRLPGSRRRFLQQATGVAAASMAALATVPATPARAAGARGAPQLAGSDRAADCCSAESAVPLMAAALYQGSYVGLAASVSGPGLFTLNVDTAQRVSLGSVIPIDVPPGFVFSSLGVARGRMALTGGLPFIVDSYEVDDELSDEVRAVMDVIPEGMPTSGRRHIQVVGVQPAVFFLDPPMAEPLALPAMPARTFGVVAGVAETMTGGPVLLVEHSDGMSESYYASAIDVIEATAAGSWTMRAAARDLGESGPNVVAVQGDAIAVGLNSMQGAKLLTSTDALAPAAETPLIAGRILGLTSGNTGFTVLTGDRRGARRWLLPAPGAAWIDNGAIGLDGETIVGAVPVAGAQGQSILLGRRTARLVDDAVVVVGQMEGGERHVV